VSQPEGTILSAGHAHLKQMTDTKPSISRGLGGLLFGIYAWLVFVVCVFFAILSALIVPGLERRRHCVATCGRLIFTLTGVHTTVRGLEKLPAGDSVVVANHASYIDGVLLQGYLPQRFSYVIKGEMQHVPLIGFVLRRVGSRFVERFDISGSARDARHLLKAARKGESLAVFPEGTFIKEPGLGRFRAGAFAAANNAGAPIVPVAILGSRKILPAGARLPRHGHLVIEILNPIDRSDPAYANSKQLAELARQSILEVLDEPDLLSPPAD
jgi:1-acyl-sn-glycerol-3-phosphate acyltransferase